MSKTFTKGSTEELNSFTSSSLLMAQESFTEREADEELDEIEDSSFETDNNNNNNNQNNEINKFNQNVKKIKISSYNKKIMSLKSSRRGVRFPVNGEIDVERHYIKAVSRKQFKEALHYSGEDKIVSHGQGDFASYASSGSRLIRTISGINAFAEAIHIAYYHHYPIILTPDCIWFTILQGISLHLHQNPEIREFAFPEFNDNLNEEVKIFRLDNHNKLMNRLSSLATLQSTRGIGISSRNLHNQSTKSVTDHKTNNLIMSLSSFGDNWLDYYNEFYETIADTLDEDLSDLAGAVFSTTTSNSRLSFQLAFSGQFRHIFQHRKVKGCGIPFVELSGTPEDWSLVKSKAKEFLAREGLDLDWWGNELIPVLSQFEDAAHGKPDIDFWQSMCNLFSGSGMNKPISGWLQVLFPYLTKDRLYETRYYQNEYLGQWRTAYEAEKAKGRDADDSGSFSFGSSLKSETDNSTKVKTKSSAWREKFGSKGILLENIPCGIASLKFDFVTSTFEEYNDLFIGEDDELEGSFDADEFGEDKLKFKEEDVEKLKMSLNSGLVGIIQHSKTRALEPMFGWVLLRKSTRFQRQNASGFF